MRFSTHLRHLATVASVTVLVVPVAGCGDSGSGPAQRLLDPPAGYTLASQSTDQLSIDDTAKVTLLPPAQSGPLLAKGGWQGSSVRIFTQGDLFVVDLAVDFHSNTQAESFAGAEVQAAADSTNATAFTSTAAPRARAYIIDSGRREGSGFVFCQGIVFTVAATAYEIRQCGPTPTDGQGPLAGTLAGAQYRRVTGGG